MKPHQFATLSIATILISLHVAPGTSIRTCCFTVGLYLMAWVFIEAINESRSKGEK